MERGSGVYNFDEHRSARQFYEDYKKHVESLEAKDKLSQEKIQSYKEAYFAFELLSPKYDSIKRNYSELYLQDENVSDIARLIPHMEDIMNEFYDNSDRSVILDRITIKALSALVRISESEIQSVDGFANSHLSSAVTQAVATSIDNIFEISANDKTGKYKEDENKIIPVEKIIYDYPDTVKIIKDQITQKVFKGKLSKDGQNKVNVTKNGKTVELNVLLTVPDMNKDENINYEKPFSYYDWCVMEAVTSLYLNGVDVIDLQSIDKVLKHNKDTRMTQKKLKEIDKSKLYDSLKRLCGNYIKFSKGNNNYKGYLLDGEFKVIDGKICLKMKSVPVLYTYADSINHIMTVKNEDLSIEISQTEDSISIYRYLIQRVIEIYGTLKTEDLFNGKKVTTPKGTNSIIIKNICDSIITDGIKDINAKERGIRERTEQILDKMKDKGFFDKYEVHGKGKNTRYELIRSEV